MATQKILIIEDDETLRGALKEIFVDEGFEVQDCDGAECAFRYLKERRPDIILTDLVMQNIDGFEVLQRLKSSEHTKNIPTLVVSNNSDDIDLSRAMELGARAFLIKAEMSLADIVKRVKEELSLAQKEES
jgi:PleD family two-component response regulator